jgi:hypothetical protein
MTSTRIVLVFSSIAAMIAVGACSSSSSDLTLGDDSSPGTDSGSGTDSTVTGNDTGAPTDSGVVDAGSDARPEPDCTGIAYCENFETYPAGALTNNGTLGPWKVDIGVPADAGGPEPMSVDNVNPYGGLQSLHIKVPNLANSSTHLLTQTKTGGTGLVGNTLWGRAMVYFKGALPNGHTWVFQGTGGSTKSGDTNMSLNLANAGTDYFLNYHGTADSGSAETSASGGTPVQDKWVCLQWEYDASGSGATDEAKVWADGTLIIDSQAKDENWQLADPFTSMQLGWVHYPQTTEAIDLYIDDFALNNSEIACP